MNLQKMMQQAQAMQSKLAQVQAKLESEESEGSSGGGAVKVRLTGKGRALGVTIDPSLMTADDRETLEDLLVAAFNNARDQADAKASEEMSKITAGLPLPPGFKLPM